MCAKATSLFVDKAIERLDRLDRKQVENLLRGLRREREFLQDVFDRLTEGVVALDADWQVIWTNQAARTLLGLEKRRRLIGESVFDLPLDEALLAALRSFALGTADGRHEEVIVRKPADGIFSVTMVGGAGGAGSEAALPGHVLIIEDLTEQRIEQARRQEAEKIASLATLTAGVAHEIKNPLNSLKIHAQLLGRMLRDEEPSEVTKERIAHSTGVILEEIDRLGRVVEQFLTAVRPTRPELRTQRLSPLIERLAGIIRPELDQKRIELALDLEPDVIELQMDESQMMEALLNIARNAIEAIETKRAKAPEAEGRIEIRTRADQKHVWIFISDTGCGIAESDLKRIAEPYYTTKFAGTGLGLMTVSRVAREHNGSMHIQSELDVGTTITLTLPRRQSQRFLPHLA